LRRGGGGEPSANHQTGWTGLIANLLEEQGGRGLVHDAYVMALMAIEEKEPATPQRRG
jgi:hypothetical protein